jgi:hypothetical protein
LAGIELINRVEVDKSLSSQERDDLVICDLCGEPERAEGMLIDGSF